jgi:propanediol dehydratase medium subunit
MTYEEKLIADVTEKITAAIQKVKNHSVSIPKSSFQMTETGQAKTGACAGEVVIGVSPSFGTVQAKAGGGIEHALLLQELSAGIEEEGLKPRVIKVMDSAQTARIAQTAAEYSGSGIGIGVQLQGAAVICKKNSFQSLPVEWYPQVSAASKNSYREIGRNAARYAKDSAPHPVPLENSSPELPPYQAKLALLLRQETEKVCQGEKAIELKID